MQQNLLIGRLNSYFSLYFETFSVSIAFLLLRATCHYNCFLCSTGIHKRAAEYPNTGKENGWNEQIPVPGWKIPVKAVSVP